MVDPASAVIGSTSTVLSQVRRAGGRTAHEVVDLVAVSGGAPAAVLLVDLSARAVVYANPVAVHLAPGVLLPAGLDAWSDAAALRDVDGAELSETNHPLSVVARSQPVAGQAVSAARATELGRRREPLWVVALPMADAPQLHGHALVVFLPLGQRRAAEGAAHAAAAQAELRDAAVLATGLSFTVADACAQDLPLVWVNPAFTTTTGYPFAEAVGRNCRFLQGPATDPAAPAAMRAALEAGESITITVLNYRKDGTAFWNELSMSPIHGPDGQLTHFVGIQADVSSRVAADAERDRALSAEQAARQIADRALSAEQAARREAEAVRAQLSLLVEATSTLGASLDVEQCRQRLAALVLPTLADWVMIATMDARGHLQDPLVRHRDPASQATLDQHAGAAGRAATPASLQVLLAAGAQAQLVSDCTGPAGSSRRPAWVDACGVLDLAGAHDACSLLLVPLPGRQHLTDVMVLVRDARSSAHTEQDLAVAADLGRRAGLVLDNARRYQGEHHIAETLQRSLLPDLPDLPGIRAAACYRASQLGAEVGGDFYELIDLPGPDIGLAIGDVAGHDILAAAAMGHLRGLLRACAYEGHASDLERAAASSDAQPANVAPGSVGSAGAAGAPQAQRGQPGTVLDCVDRLMLGLRIPTLASAAFGCLRPRPDGTWLLQYANAGHPPLMVRHRDGAVEILDDADGLLLGVTPSKRASASRVLTPGAMVLAYTDGLIERRGETLDTGLARLAAVLADSRADIDDVCQDLITQLGDGQDDIAVLAVQI